MLDSDILQMGDVAVHHFGRDWVDFTFDGLPTVIKAWATKEDAGYRGHLSHRISASTHSQDDILFPTESAAVKHAMRGLIDSYHRIGVIPDSADADVFVKTGESVPHVVSELPQEPSVDTGDGQNIKVENLQAFNFDRGGIEIEQTEAGLEKFLTILDSRREALLHIATMFVAGKSVDLKPYLLFFFGCFDRSSQVLSAFVSATRNRQMFVAGALLRVQLDTFLRMKAKDLVSDQTAFFQAVFDGERIDKMVSHDGQKLTDAYLVKILGDRDDWIPRVYKQTSGFVHLSAAHCFGVAQHQTDASGSEYVTLQIGGKQDHIPLPIWFDAALAFDHVTMLIAQELQRLGVEMRRSALGPNTVIMSRQAADALLAAASGSDIDGGSSPSQQ